MTDKFENTTPFSSSEQPSAGELEQGGACSDNTAEPSCTQSAQCAQNTYASPENGRYDTPEHADGKPASGESSDGSDQTVYEELLEIACAEAENLDYLPKPMPKSVKRRSHMFLSMFIPLLIIFIILFFATARIVFGKGWLTNALSGDSNLKSFTIPIADHPQLEDKYYQPDGRYTVEGVAKACSDSVVTIEVYIDDTVFGAYSQGSGIIMTEDGYIITNAHVIEKNSIAIIVRLSDGTEYNATVVGSDTSTDLAVIKINAKDLQPAQFGSSSDLELGEQVVTLGTPAGFENSVTTGVVSGLHRMIQTNVSRMSIECLQIDAAINPGNSGGALFNMWGQVVGIVSSKIESVQYDNVGFAIAFDEAKPIIEYMIENGSILGRPKIGISFYEVSSMLASVYGMPAGLHIAEIEPGSDIGNTELMIGDVITEINGIPVESVEQVQDIIYQYQAGDTLTATVVRILEDGSTEEFEISFKLMEDDESSIQPDDNVKPGLDPDGGYTPDDGADPDSGVSPDESGDPQMPQVPSQGSDDGFGISPDSDESQGTPGSQDAEPNSSVVVPSLRAA